MTSRAPRVRGYRVEQMIGVGGSGTVWLARVRGSGDPVAIKVLPRALVGEGLAEAHRLRGIDHPNLIGVREVQELRTGVALVLDYASGGTLAALVARRRRLPAGEVIAALTPIASAVAAVHAAGLVHGDITPANVLFGADGLPVLGDLGTTFLADLPRRGRTALAYADPMAEQGWFTGAAGDVYSLGAVTHFALTGRAPGPGVDDQLDETDHRVASIVRRAVDGDPSRRGSALDFALDLRHSGPATGVDLRAGRHSAALPLPVITRGARLPGVGLSLSARAPRRGRRPGRDG